MIWSVVSIGLVHGCMCTRHGCTHDYCSATDCVCIYYLLALPTCAIRTNNPRTNKAKPCVHNHNNSYNLPTDLYAVRNTRVSVFARRSFCAFVQPTGEVGEAVCRICVVHVPVVGLYCIAYSIEQCALTHSTHSAYV